MNIQTQNRPFQPGRHGDTMTERVPDSYKLPAKLREPTMCPKCGAVYHLGRWQWLQRPEGPGGPEEVVCSACHRIADGCPAGYVYIEGDFATAHRDELLRLVRHHEERARAEHAMERIIAIVEHPGQMIVTTTDLHLARGLGTALEGAFQGTLELKYAKDENLLRVYWRR